MVSDLLCQYCKRSYHPMALDRHVIDCSQPSEVERGLALNAAAAIVTGLALTPAERGRRQHHAYVGLVGQLVLARWVGSAAYQSALYDVQRIIMHPPRDEMLSYDCRQNGIMINVKIISYTPSMAGADPFMAMTNVRHDVMYLAGRSISRYDMVQMKSLLGFEPLGWAWGKDLRKLTDEELKRLEMHQCINDPTKGWGTEVSKLSSLNRLPRLFGLTMHKSPSNP